MKESKLHAPGMSHVPRYSLKQYLALMVMFYGSFVFLTYPAYTSALVVSVLVLALLFSFNKTIKTPVLYTPKIKNE